MPSKLIYKTVFDEEGDKYEIRVTDEFGNPQTEYKFESQDSIEAVKGMMEVLKEKIRDETLQNPFLEIIYVSPEQFEVINHRD